MPTPNIINRQRGGVVWGSVIQKPLEILRAYVIERTHLCFKEIWSLFLISVAHSLYESSFWPQALGSEHPLWSLPH